MSRRLPATALLLARTARHLRPAQVAHRVRLRAQQAAFARFPTVLERALEAPSPPAGAAWPAGFAPLDGQDVGDAAPAADAYAAGRFTFLAEERTLTTPTGAWDWEQAQALRLWRFHLHGFEWAWAFAAHPDRAMASSLLGDVLRSWTAGTAVGRGDAWAPYVVSLRAWALCGLHGPLLAGTDIGAGTAAALAVHARFLRSHLELDVGGNHLVKNLKALIGLGVFLDEVDVVDTAAARLATELPRQVLEDGGHFELSPSYHCQVLGDLVDVGGLLAAAGRPPVEGLEGAVASMRSWLGAMLLPDGDVPLFNDGGPVDHRRIALLAPTRAAAGPTAPGITLLPASGHAVVRAGPLLLVADVGLPCPPELPAHAHADCLSFQLAVDGRLVVADTGTSTYAAGARRDHERSTAAHSTVEVDGEDQTEVWGAFRAARRAHPHLERAGLDADGTAVVMAWHDGYERLRGRPRHRRTWRITAGAVEIVDQVDGDGEHRCVARLILAPGTPVEQLGDGRFRAGPVEVLLAGGRASQEQVEVAPDFGRLVPATCLRLQADGPLPHRLVTTITTG
ncbi:MAG: heparinase II/III domain-containing protein [Acidimicrobiales bacterium]